MIEDDGRMVAVTYTFVVRVLDGETVADAVEEYINSVGWVLDSPVKVEWL